MNIYLFNLRRTFTVVLVAVAVISTGMILFYNKHDIVYARNNGLILPETAPPKFSMARYELVLRKLAVDRNVFLSIVDFSHADFATNLYETSYKRLAINNYLFVALNKKCCDILDARGINCLHHFPDYEIGEAPSQVRSESFNLKTNARARIVLDALKLGYNPFLVDLDIVFLSDPGASVYPLGIKHALVVQDDGGGQFNTGFYYARTSQMVIDFFDIAYNLSQSDMAKKANDQKIMRHILNANLSKVEMHLLDGKKFVTGLDYWETNQISFNDVHPWKKRDEGFPDAVIIHNNYIATKEAKVYRFKESLLWSVDDNGYYSDTKRRYLTYENPYINAKNGMQLEHDALLNALSIGYLLNRTVILPAFHCFKTRGYFCRSNEQECSLLPLYHVERFDSQFSDAYREHVFLSHELVPKSTRTSQTEPVYINSKIQAQIQPSMSDNKLSRGYTPANEEQGATAAEIRRWFSGVKEKVLVFRNMYGAFAGFEETPETADIVDRLGKALAGCNYRQRRCKHATWFTSW